MSLMPPELAVFVGADLHESADIIVSQEQSREEMRLELERQQRRRKLSELIQEGLRGFDSSLLRKEHEVRQSGTSIWQRLPMDYDVVEGDAYLNQAAEVLAAFKVTSANTEEFPHAA